MFDLLKRYDVELSPEVRGRVSIEGVPLPNLEVYRELFYEERYLEKAYTDSEGRFTFPKKSIKSRSPGKLFGETHITQVITVDHNDAPYLLWRTSTTRLETPKVLRSKLEKLDCDLTWPEKLQHFEVRENPSFTHNIRSICRWIDSGPTKAQD